uniref:ARM repeat superfamily protein n=1 Tax=Arundo donax TaxID=35708 RepID=A0A0A9DE17_ARUDO
MARIRILSLIAKLFTVSSYTATAIRDSNLISLFEDEIKDRRDMLKTLSALEVLYELVEHPHSNIFLMKTNLLQLIIDVINDSSADSVIQSRAALISGRLLSSADAFTAIDQSCVTNLLLAIDKILKMEESHNGDEIESALETLGLIGTTTQGAQLLLTSSNVTRHVVESSFDRQGRGRQLAALHALGSICGVDRQEDHMKLDGQGEEYLKRLVYSTAANSPKLTPSALLLSILQQDPDIRIAGYRVISGMVNREWCLREVCSNSEIIRLVTDPAMETTKLGMEARYDCCVAINKALSSSHLLHEASLSELIGKLNDAVRRGPYLSDRKRVEARPVVVPAERF